MSAAVDCLKAVRLGAPQGHLNLTRFPLLRDGAGQPGHLLLLDAIDLATKKAAARRRMY